MNNITSKGFAISIAISTITASIMVPPAQGTMLAVALGDAPAYRLLDEPDVRLLGAGKIPGSLMISAELGDLWRVALRNRILLLNGAARLCSARATR